MNEDNTNDNDKMFNGDVEIPISQFGFQSANDAKSKPDSIVDGLEKVYEWFLKNQRSKAQEKIAKLEDEIAFQIEKKNGLIGKLKENNDIKEARESEIENLELQKINDLSDEEETPDIVGFSVGAFILLLLTCYLFIFYSSSGYSAIYGVKPGSLGFLNPNVFIEAGNKGGGVIAFICLFPVIFLAFGFAFHTSIENNKKRVKEGLKKDYRLLIGLLFITFIADCFIGYKITEAIYRNSFDVGHIEQLWNSSMVLSDINFYLVLILGFLVYIIWGIVLNYVLSHPYLKTHSEKAKVLEEHANKKIDSVRNQLEAIRATIIQIESDITGCEIIIEKKSNAIFKYRGLITPVDTDILKGKIGEFMAGWENFTHGNNRVEQAEHLNKAARQKKDQWLTSKIESLIKDED